MTIKAEVYCYRVTDGTHDTPKPTKEGYPLVTSKNIMNGELNLEDTYLISAEDYEQVNRRSKVDQWDILFSMIGTVGEVYLHRDENCDFAIKNIGLFKMGGNKEKALKLFYFLKSPYFQRLIKVRLNGSIQSYLTLGFLRNIELPDLDKINKEDIEKIEAIQKKVDSNKELRKKLLEYAQLTYRKWFVEYDFPDELGNPYHSSGGEMQEVDNKMIPKGWTRNRIKAIVESTKNGDWGEEDIEDGAIEQYCIRGIDIETLGQGEIGETPIRYIKPTDANEKKLFHNNIVLEISHASNPGRQLLIRNSLMKRLDKPIYFSNFSKVIQAKEPYAPFLYLLLKNLYERKVLLKYTASTNIRNISVESLLNNFRIVLPPADVAEKFNQFAEVLFDRINLIGEENEKLFEVRDILIKKYIK
ncbi:restriction endonuclease subunit S [Fredinandcohnia sp. QZ13]|uniref:restriction endonuclease subunit S n=1 Tax=Fredinandcohnia sp. QZ13 TaxID=3073144 RepID=UPI0028531678|nr:restriction endonuclease subunit S [Fredinandcohnia sp. QZ13]MDR4887968.1 restriction endonuclease subunit S [Fredinandcohnia sp. QZ13]